MIVDADRIVMDYRCVLSDRTLLESHLPEFETLTLSNTLNVDERNKSRMSV
jgi:hypothetical protein